MIKKVLATVCVIICLISFVSCGNKENEKLLKELPAKIEEGRILLDYIYGEGLPYDTLGEEPFRRGYTAVDGDAEFVSLSEFRNALSESFTEDCIQIFDRTAFERTTVEGTSYLPRYIEDENGTLYINKEYESYIIKREPNLESLRIVKSNKFMAEVEITMINEDGSSEKDSFVVRKEDGVWKFDSAAIL